MMNSLDPVDIQAYHNPPVKFQIVLIALKDLPVMMIVLLENYFDRYWYIPLYYVVSVRCNTLDKISVKFFIVKCALIFQ